MWETGKSYEKTVCIFNYQSGPDTAHGGLNFDAVPRGGAATPKLTQIFDVFRVIVCRSTGAKPNEIEITFMPHFVNRGILKRICVTGRGYFAW